MCFWLMPNLYAQNTLPEYLQIARKNSPLIKDFKNQSIANKAEAERLKALLNKPKLDLSANYLLAPVYNTDKNQLELNPKSAVNYYGYDLGNTNGGAYQALLTLTKPLFNSKVSETVANQSLVTAQVNDNAAILSAHDLEKLITDQYILCLQDRKQADYAREILKLLAQQTNIVKKFVEHSLLKSSDLTLLNIEYEGTTGLLATYEANYRRDFLDLNILAGLKDTTVHVLDSLTISLKPDVFSSAYLDKYRLDSLSLVATQKAFETKYKPQINFFTNTGLNANYIPTIPNRFGLSAGLSLTWNILDGNQKYLNRNKTSALLNSVTGYRENFQTQNTLRKTKILAEISAYENRITIIRGQLNDYNSLLKAYTTQIIQGELSIIDFINVLKNKSATERDYLLLQTNRNLLINSYNYWNW
ncbi:MAG: hypothetical protein BGO69_14915 [Bacteroidetes bacterium 46-16]|nr:MAG: hypothetical protein BGO69_14915 [Bacteroidetes bacterium 46-16]